MSGSDETFRAPPPHAAWRADELLGRRVRFRDQVGRVEEVNVLSAPQVAIITRDGLLLRVPAPDWGEIEVLR
jgi:hypothetical protein